MCGPTYPPQFACADAVIVVGCVGLPLVFDQVVLVQLFATFFWQQAASANPHCYHQAAVIVRICSPALLSLLSCLISMHLKHKGA